jgi:hypothetical protein
MSGLAYSAVGYLWKVDVPDDFTAVVYQNTTSLFTFQYTSMWGAMIPKHVWEPTIAGTDKIYGTSDDVDPRGIAAWNTPDPTNSTFSMLVGTGPWMFFMGDWHTGEYVHLRANRNYFVSAEDSIGDSNYDLKVDILDIAAVAKAFGTKLGDKRWNVYADINYDKKVDILDIALVAKNWHHTW